MMAPQVHAVTKKWAMPTDRPSEAIDQSSIIIINTLKEEIGRSQEVLLGRITQLEEKCNAVHQQQAVLRWTIETQIVPYLCTMSELLVDVCEQLATAKVIKLTDQQQTKLHRLRHPPIASQVPVSPSLISCGFPKTHLLPAREQPPPFEVKCIPSSASPSSSSPFQ
jgi:hypothetical protein